MTKVPYVALLADVLRYYYHLAEKKGGDLSVSPDLPPAAEEALRYLTRRVAQDLRLPEFTVRRGLLHAASRQLLPARLVFISASAELQSANVDKV